MPSKVKYLWIDVETTGLHPGHDRLLEVAVLPTDENGVPTETGFKREIKASLDDVDQFVYDMHLESGLIPEKGATETRGVHKFTALMELESYLKYQVRQAEGKPVIAGWNTQFDLGFLRADGLDPLSIPGMDYHAFDLHSVVQAVFGRYGVSVSSLSKAATAFGVTDEDHKPHRALEDCKTAAEVWNEAIINILDAHHQIMPIGFSIFLEEKADAS